MSDNPIHINPKLNANTPKSKEVLTLKELHALFIKTKQYAENTAPSTIRNYIQNFNLLIQFKPDISLTDLKEETILQFLEYLNCRERKVGNKYLVRTFKPSSVASVRGKLNSFFKWLMDRNYITRNPFEKIPYPNIYHTDRRAFMLSELEKISFAVNVRIKWQSILIKKRNNALLMFLLYTGVRKEELLGLKLSDINFENKLVTIRAETSKSKFQRIIPINSELIPHLEDYCKYRQSFSSPFLWVSGTNDRNFTEHGLKHLINLITETTSINCHVHRFRHTFATNYYKLTNDVFGLQKLMGHRSLRMTLIYLRSLPDEHIISQINRLSINKFL